MSADRNVVTPAVAHGARVPAILVLGFVAEVVCLVALGVLARTFDGPERSALDATASPFVHAFASPVLDAVMQAATFVGSDAVLVPVIVLCCAWLLSRGELRAALYLAASSIGSIAINGTMKVLFQRPRPELPWSRVVPDYSFPSGHSMNSFVVYVSIGLLIWVIAGRRLGATATAGALVLVALIGLSRIYLGYHYLTDVLGGFIAASGWMLVVAGAVRAGPWLERWRDRGAPKTLRTL